MGGAPPAGAGSPGLAGGARVRAAVGAGAPSPPSVDDEREGRSGFLRKRSTVNSAPLHSTRADHGAFTSRSLRSPLPLGFSSEMRWPSVNQTVSLIMAMGLGP